MEWSLRPDAPIYPQLCDQLTFAIVSGAFLPGERLRAVRDLAAEAGVNPNTMQRALHELECRGLVHSRRTAGRFVTEDAARIEAARLDAACEQGRAFLSAMERLGYNRIQTVMLLEKLRAETDA